MYNLYKKEELLNIGFEAVGENVKVSRDARFFAVSGRLGDEVRIDAFAILTGHIELGNNVHVSPFCFLNGTGGRITMADNSGVSSHVSIFTKSADYTGNDLLTAAKVTGNVHIGTNSIIGSGCKIMPEVTIEADVSVGCNCVINSDIEKGSIIVNRGMGLITLSRRDEE
ncbi:MAG: hypothetical protein PHV59_07060 [Victivallales bacterium]|nr:hypothetical protein [Victivallales bacterium]